VLRYGSLPVQLERQDAQTVSASLGKDSLHAGLLAGAVGTFLVLLYMILYYRILGAVVLAGLMVWASLQWSIVSYLEYQGSKLVDRFDRDTYRVLAGAMDRHDISRGRGTIQDALGLLAAGDTRLIGLGIQDDILYGPAQVQRLVATAAAAGLAAEYRELRSNKGHDAFLVEWPQLTEIIGGLLPSE